jgi:hypothetical protein
MQNYTTIFIRSVNLQSQSLKTCFYFFFSRRNRQFFFNTLYQNFFNHRSYYANGGNLESSVDSTEKTVFSNLCSMKIQLGWNLVFLRQVSGVAHTTTLPNYQKPFRNQSHQIGLRILTSLLNYDFLSVLKLV